MCRNIHVSRVVRDFPGIIQFSHGKEARLDSQLCIDHKPQLLREI